MPRKIPAFTSRRISAGPDVSVSDADIAVLNVIWTASEPLSLRQVHDEIVRITVDKQESAISTSTVNSILARLVERQILHAEAETPRTTRYSAVMDREQFTARSMESVARKLMPQLTGDVARGPVYSKLQALLSEFAEEQDDDE